MKFRLNQQEVNYWSKRIPLLYNEFKHEVARQVYSDGSNRYHDYDKNKCEIIREICKPFTEEKNFYTVKIVSGLTEEEFNDMLVFVKAMYYPEEKVWYEHN